MAKKGKKSYAVVVRLDESDMDILNFLIKMFKTSRSNVVRRALNLLRQEVIIGRFDNEISE